MLPVIKINLLPYREELAKKQKKQFQSIMLLGVVAGIGLGVLGYMALNGRISNQEERNQVLQQGIDKLDEEIKQIEDLKRQRDNFLERKNQVEILQNKRFEAARMLDTLNVLVPDGLYLTSIAANGPSSYTISGRAISDGKIAIFMRNLPSTGLFGVPELASIKRDNDAQSFSLKVTLNNPADKSNTQEIPVPASVLPPEAVTPPAPEAASAPANAAPQAPNAAQQEQPAQGAPASQAPAAGNAKPE